MYTNKQVAAALAVLNRAVGGPEAGPAFSRPELAKEFGEFCLKLYRGETRDMTPGLGGQSGYMVPTAEISAEVTRMTMSVWPVQPGVGLMST